MGYPVKACTAFHYQTLNPTTARTHPLGSAETRNLVSGLRGCRASGVSGLLRPLGFEEGSSFQLFRVFGAPSYHDRRGFYRFDEASIESRL